MIILKIDNCHECPFSNNDNETGRDQCNMKNIKLDYKNWEELPEDEVHKECPLIDADYLIKHAKN